MKSAHTRVITVEGDTQTTADISVQRSTEDPGLIVLGQHTPITGNLNAVILTPQQAGELIKALVEIAIN